MTNSETLLSYVRNKNVHHLHYIIIRFSKFLETISWFRNFSLLLLVGRLNPELKCFISCFLGIEIIFHIEDAQFFITKWNSSHACIPTLSVSLPSFLPFCMLLLLTCQSCSMRWSFTEKLHYSIHIHKYQ